MFTKGWRRVWQGLWVGMLVCLMGLLPAVPCSAQKAPKGKIIVATTDGFAMTGGDYHTSQMGPALTTSYLIHEGLFRVSPEGEIVPALAKSWRIAQDGLSISLTLDERAKFHNGAPVTAGDVKFSYERAVRPEMKYQKAGQQVRFFDRIELKDDHHLTIYFKSPFPGIFDWPGALFAIVPKSYVEKVGDAEYAKRPIGAGPFRWVDYQQDVFVNVEAVENHYRKVPSVKSINVKFRIDNATIVAMLKAGEADVIKVPVPNYPEVKNDPNLKVVWSKFNYGYTLVYPDLAFPNEPSPFHDIRVRQATSYAINRKAICEKVLLGVAETWGDIWSPKHPGYDPNIKPTPYDPEKAKALLKEAGYPNGFDTTFYCGMFGDCLPAQAIVSDLARVGIKVKLMELEFGTFISYAREKKFRGLWIGGAPMWLGVKAPGSALDVLFSPDIFWSYHTVPEGVAAWEKLSSLYDEKAVVAQSKELSRVFRKIETRSLLWAGHLPIGLSKRVKSYRPLPGWPQLAGFEYLELKE